MGSNDTSSKSRPLTAAERESAFNTGIYNLARLTGGETPDVMSRGEYGRSKGLKGKDLDTAYGRYTQGQYREAEPQFAEYESPEARTLGGGDYDRLEQQILQSRTAPLDAAWSRRGKEIDQDMADRGLWSSGVGIQAKNDTFAQDFLPAYTQAGGEAATQRYGAQMQENQSQNAQDMENASRKFDSKWRPFDALMGLYNGTGGVVSSSQGGGWSI